MILDSSTNITKMCKLLPTGENNSASLNAYSFDVQAISQSSVVSFIKEHHGYHLHLWRKGNEAESCRNAMDNIKHVLVIHYSFFNIQSLKVARCYYNEAGEYSLRHDCSTSVSFPPSPCTRARARAHNRMYMRMYAWTNPRRSMRADARAHAHKQLDVYLRCELSQFAVRSLKILPFL